MAPKTIPPLGSPNAKGTTKRFAVRKNGALIAQHSERERAIQVAEILREGAPSGKWQVLDAGVEIWPGSTRAKEKK